MKTLQKRFIRLCKSFIQRPSVNDLIFGSIATLIYGIVAILFGLTTKLFSIKLYSGDFKTLLILPFVLIIIPSIPEEIFFRGLLLPSPSEFGSKKQVLFGVLASMSLFILWHPFTALTIYPQVRELYTDIRFITIVAMLSFVCTITYLKSGSIWIPIVIHWLTVVVWMFFLGGRNFAVDMV